MSCSFSYVGDVLAKKAHTHSLPLDMLWHSIPLCQVILSLVLNDSLYSPALWPCSRAKLASGYKSFMNMCAQTFMPCAASMV
ncbi:hypothetical protein D6C87_00173 [Aureobasidium pullulans]|uniref:Uncharacterized protein n=1 Tax=Aureobasidium pullulans TaxID=5580 RepID=A0AB38M905_AURPU|nr:hypothetical protein D6C94_01152 [Aureobasidium pullulans]THZ49097.1 hypothetical protein D6C87_00173 [Aureobasidium pullulans]TIA50956.1 hypothetical protein D6C79_02791 [Aureobasidium pullulans]